MSRARASWPRRKNQTARTERLRPTQAPVVWVTRKRTRPLGQPLDIPKGVIRRFTVRHFSALLWAALLSGCSRGARDGGGPADVGNPMPATVATRNLDAAPTNASVPTVSAVASAARSLSLPLERTVHFTWTPPSARPSEYSMPDPPDQHTIWLFRGVEPGKVYPVLVAFHGQPRRGRAPRTYAFPRTVADVARALVQSGEVAPFVLVTPVFRYLRQNWPNFDSVEFVDELKRVLGHEGITTGRLYFVGHSGAAGCGGGGLNHVDEASPSAVGFFDTCLGSGFLESVRELAKHRVPTFIAHSVETAGVQPREPTEYESQFDFGRVYSKVGLRPTSCPEHLPEAPLRKLAYQCSTNEERTVRALVIDTGEGKTAHEALVPVALRYFLREYMAAVGSQPGASK